MSDAPPAKRPNPRPRWRPRFSLRTLMLCVLLFAAAYGLWFRRDAWVLERHLAFGPEFPADEETAEFRIFLPIRYWERARFSADRSMLLAGHLSSPNDQSYNSSSLSMSRGDGDEAWPATYSLEDGRMCSARLSYYSRRLSPRGQWVIQESYAPFASLLETASATSDLRLRSIEDEGQLKREEDGKVLSARFLFGHDLEVAPDERRVAYLEKKDTVVVFDVFTEKAQARLHVSPEESPTRALFSPGGRYLAIGDVRRESVNPFVKQDSKLVLWDLHAGKRVPHFASTAGEFGDFAPDDSKLVVYARDTSVKPKEGEAVPETAQLVDTATGKVLREWKDAARLGPFSADGRLLLLCTASDQTETQEELLPTSEKLLVTVLDAGSLDVVATFGVRGYDVRFSDDGENVLVRDMTGTENDEEGDLDIHDARSGSLMCTLSQQHRAGVGRDRALVPGEGEGAVQVLDLATGERLATLQGPPARAHYGEPALWACAAVFTEGDAGAWIARSDRTAQYWVRRRPEWWWGLAWLPECWLTALFALLLLWSLVRDFKTLRKAKAAA